MIIEVDIPLEVAIAQASDALEELRATQLVCNDPQMAYWWIGRLEGSLRILLNCLSSPAHTMHIA